MPHHTPIPRPRSRTSLHKSTSKLQQKAGHQRRNTCSELEKNSSTPKGHQRRNTAAGDIDDGLGPTATPTVRHRKNSTALDDNSHGSSTQQNSKQRINTVSGNSDDSSKPRGYRRRDNLVVSDFDAYSGDVANTPPGNTPRTPRGHHQRSYTVDTVDLDDSRSGSSGLNTPRGSNGITTPRGCYRRYRLATAEDFKLKPNIQSHHQQSHALLKSGTMTQSGTDVTVRGKTLLSPRPQGQVGDAFSSAPALDVRNQETRTRVQEPVQAQSQGAESLEQRNRKSAQALYALGSRDILTSRSSESMLDEFHDDLNLGEKGFYDSGLVRSVESLLSCNGDLDHSMDHFQPILHSTHTSDPDGDDLHLNLGEEISEEDEEDFELQLEQRVRFVDQDGVYEYMDDQENEYYDQDYGQEHEPFEQYKHDPEHEQESQDEEDDEEEEGIRVVEMDGDLPDDEPFYIPGIGLVQSTESLGISPIPSYENFNDVREEVVPQFFSPRPPSQKMMFSATRSGIVSPQYVLQHVNFITF